MAKKAKSKSKKPETQKELIMVMVLSLFLGAGGGFAIGALATSGDSESTDSTSEMKESMHSHGSMFMVDSEEAPTLNLMVMEDAKSGYNVRLVTEDFTFTPENVNGDNVIGEGHAHLYVDGEKVGRLYGPDFHYDGSFEGTKTFRATLNANDHSEYAVEGEVIEATVEVMHDSYDADHDESHSTDDSHSHSDM